MPLQTGTMGLQFKDKKEEKGKKKGIALVQNPNCAKSRHNLSRHPAGGLLPIDGSRPEAIRQAAGLPAGRAARNYTPGQPDRTPARNAPPADLTAGITANHTPATAAGVLKGTGHT